MNILVCLLSFVMMASLGRGPDRPPGARSPALATELAGLMSGKKLQTIAAPSPKAPDEFVAAMVFPGVQLLVVAGRHSSPPLVMSQLAQKQYSEVYAELQEASIKDSKVFFQDMGADGLGASDNVDVMYEKGRDQTIFDGDWKRVKMSREAYESKLSAADTRYAELLQILIGALQPGQR